MPALAPNTPLLVSAVILLASVSSSTLRAAPDAEPGPGTASCDQANALSALACELSAGLGSRKPSLVVALPATWTRKNPKDKKSFKAKALAQRLAQVVAARLGATGHASAQSLAAAHARGRQSSGLLILTPVITGARIEITADLFQGHQSFWERAKGSAPVALAHTFATRALDPELRAFFKKTPLVVTRVDKVRLNTDQTLALACGDLNADGSLELALASRHSVSLGRAKGGQFKETLRAPLSRLSEIAAAPLREPIGTLNLVRGAYLDVGSTDREYTTRLSPLFEPLERTRGVLPWPGADCVRRDGLGLSPAPHKCIAPPRNNLGQRLPPVDAVAAARLTTETGQAFQIRATRRLADSVLELSDDRGRAATLRDVGAQIAVGDMNQDGLPEIFVSQNTHDRAQDALIGYTWAESGLSKKLSLDVPGGVNALALCPAEEIGLSPLVIATGDELWIVR